MYSILELKIHLTQNSHHTARFLRSYLALFGIRIGIYWIALVGFMFKKNEHLIETQYAQTR